MGEHNVMILSGENSVWNMAGVIILNVTKIVIIAKWLGYNHEEFQREWLRIDEVSKEVEWLKDTEELGVSQVNSLICERQRLITVQNQYYSQGWVKFP